MAVLMTACGDISGHIVYGLMVIVASVGFYLFFITLIWIYPSKCLSHHLGKLRARLSAHVALIFVSFACFILLLSFLSWPRF
jgi:hypothetical protein